MKRRPQRSRGATLLLLLLLLGVAAAALIIAAVRHINPDEIKRQRSAEALQIARQAVISWSVSQMGTAGSGNCSGGGGGTACNPGEMPCPDRYALTDLALGSSSLPCNGATATTRIGRLPWRTLGIAPALDGYGQPLWLAVDLAYAKRNTANASAKVNNDVLASLQIVASDGVTVQTQPGNRALAVIFAPGPAQGGQARPSNTVADYLDRAAGLDNSAPGGPFIVPAYNPAVAANEQANDQLVFITAADLFREINLRLGAEVTTLLADYWQANGSLYPQPASLADSICRNSTSNAACNPQPAGFCRGIVPRRYPGTTPVQPGSLWYVQNVWHRGIYYAVGAVNGGGCQDPVVAGVSGSFDAIFILPGPPLGGQVRLAGTDVKPGYALSDYLEDAANQDGWTDSGAAADAYVLPGPGSNDVMYLCRMGECREAHAW